MRKNRKEFLLNLSKPKQHADPIKELDHTALVSRLVRQVLWTHNLIILNQSKTDEERKFYLKQAIQERWSKRELERQI